LHPDSIEIDWRRNFGKRGFQRFIGISPYRYRDLFEKGKRKYATGKIQDWNLGEMRPMIEVLYPSYFEEETFVVELLKDRIAQLTNLPSGDDTAHVLG
jgi:cytidine deaminase